MTCRKLLQLLVLPALLFLSQITFAQDRVISGRVTDSTGAGVAGVTVTAKGTRIATQTAADGTYSLKVPSTVTSLVFSSVGMTTQETSVSGKSSVNVSMSGTPTSMNEVVVIGYGTRLKKDLTGAVTAVTEKDFNTGVVISPEALIAGKVAGVQISSNSGAPGSGSRIRIRGGASLNASNDPLIVLDGVPLDNSGISGQASQLAMINPDDIESFNILKDASATAIYGSRASNGVIIINTKKGKGGKAKFNFNSTLGLATPGGKADVLSHDQFIAYVKSHGTPQQIAMLGGSNTDWQDQVYQNATTFDNNLSVAGTLKSMPYRVSLGYLNQDGVLRTGNLKRKSASIKINPLLFHGIVKMEFNVKGSLDNSRFANEGAIGSAAQFDPTQPVFAASKRFGGYWEWLDPVSSTGLRSLAPRNPVGLLEQRLDESDVKRSIGSLLLDFKLSKYLHMNVNMGYDVSKSEGTVFVPDSASSSYMRYKDANNVFHGGVKNSYRQSKSNTLWEHYLNWVRDFNSIESHFDVMVGYTYQDFFTTIYNGYTDPEGVLSGSNNGKPFKWNPYSDFTTDGTLVSAPTFLTDKPENNLSSFISRLYYTFRNKYLLTATIRRDGSSRFSETNRWGWFPSFAFAWKMKDEDFLSSDNLITDMKLRLGYGVTGQQDGIGNYTFVANYSTGTSTAQYQFGSNYYTVYRPDGYNPNLKWEQTETYNAGVDFGLLPWHLNGSIDVYYKKTTDLINEINQPAGTNFSNKILANVGDMENRGIELTLNAQPIRNRNLTWDVNYNITYNKNKITKLTIVDDPNFPGNQFGGISGGTGNTILINTVGYNRAAFYVYQQVYNSKGVPIEDLFVDRNGDGQITDKDLYQYKGVDPKLFMGFSTNVNWKKWFGGLVARANIGNYMYNNRFAGSGTERNILNPLSYLQNGSVNVLETDFIGGGSRYFLSDYYVENASFLRMDNIYVGYNLGNRLGKTTNLRLSGNVQNVFTVTKYRGVDPEINGGIDNSFYPRPRVFSLSLNLDF